MSRETVETETNPVAAALLGERSRFTWTLSGRGGTEFASYYGWPKDEAKARMVMAAFGLTAAPERADWGWNPFVDLVQKLVREGRRLDRAGFLHLNHALARAAGMGPTAPVYEASGSWNPHGIAARQPKVEGYYLKPVVRWYDDKTVTLEVEDVAAEGDEIFSLYAVIGCEHAFSASSGGRCITDYACNKCGYSYTIDSSD